MSLRGHGDRFITATRDWSEERGEKRSTGKHGAKIAMGRVICQAESAGGRLRVLMYWSAPLSPAQSQWHPLEQELWGILQLKREAVKHFGRIPCIPIFPLRFVSINVAL